MNIIASLILAALFVPQGSDRQLEKNPLAKGEVAYVGEGGEAVLYVGAEGGERNPVVDESALRGYAYEYIDRQTFVVLPVTNLVREADTDTLTFANFTEGVTNTFKFKFVVPSGTRFDDVEFKNSIKMATGSRTILKSCIRKIVSGNEVTVVMDDKVDYGVKLVVSDFKVKRISYGNPDYVNDLTEKVINIHDTASEDAKLGVKDWPLGKWRKNLLHFYDGNRGEHWANYAATNNVKMNNRQIAFGRRDKGIPQYAIGQSATDSNVVVTTSFGRDAVRVYQTESTSAANHISFGYIVASNDVVTFTLAISNEVFNAANLRLYATDRYASGEAKWHEVSYTVVSTNDPITVTTTRTNPKECYYRMSYGNSHVVVEIADTLKANRLLVKDANGVYNDILAVTNSGAVAYFSANADYVLQNLAENATNAVLASGTIANLTTTGGPLTVKLSLGTDNYRSCDALLRLVNTTDVALGITTNSNVELDGAWPSTVKAGTNLVMFTKTAYANGKSIITATSKEIK